MLSPTGLKNSNSQRESTYLFKAKRWANDEQFNRLISTREFCDRFHVVPVTAIRWAMTGKIWGTKIGSRWFFDPDSVPKE
jgi:hypothetical protein